jgi:hypothetical protein
MDDWLGLVNRIRYWTSGCELLYESSTNLYQMSFRREVPWLKDGSSRGVDCSVGKDFL